MMLTLIPFFDRNMSVSAYSLFTRKNNFLMNPSLLGSRQFDGAAYVDGLELIQELGTTTLSGGKPIFVSLNNISIFSSLESECKNTNHAPILLIDQTFPPVSMYTDRIRELRESLSIIIVTHNMQQAARVSDYTAFFYMGRLIEHNATDVMFTRPAKKQTEDYITGRFG